MEFSTSYIEHLEINRLGQSSAALLLDGVCHKSRFETTLVEKKLEIVVVITYQMQ